MNQLIEPILDNAIELCLGLIAAFGVDALPGSKLSLRHVFPADSKLEERFAQAMDFLAMCGAWLAMGLAFGATFVVALLRHGNAINGIYVCVVLVGMLIAGVVGATVWSHGPERFYSASDGVRFTCRTVPLMFVIGRILLIECL